MISYENMWINRINSLSHFPKLGKTRSTFPPTVICTHIFVTCKWLFINYCRKMSSLGSYKPGSIASLLSGSASTGSQAPETAKQAKLKALFSKAPTQDSKSLTRDSKPASHSVSCIHSNNRYFLNKLTGILIKIQLTGILIYLVQKCNCSSFLHASDRFLMFLIWRLSIIYL